jgi:hypothetical protein
VIITRPPDASTALAMAYPIPFVPPVTIARLTVHLRLSDFLDFVDFFDFFDFPAISTLSY